MTALERTLFVSWSHGDYPRVQALMSLLEPELKGLAGVNLSLWSDSMINLGDDWRREILGRLAECDYALALISPRYITRPFIVAEEIPQIVGPGAVTWVLPVGLQPVALDGSRDLHGLQAAQLHLHRARNGQDRFFSQLDAPGKDAFAAALATKIRNRILRDEGLES